MLTGIKTGVDVRPTKAQGTPEERWVRQSDPTTKTRGTQINAVHLNEFLANIRHMIKEKLRVGMKLDGLSNAQINAAIKFNEKRILYWIMLGYTGSLAVTLPNTLDELNKGPGDYVRAGGQFVVIDDKNNNEFGLRDVDDIVEPLTTRTLWERGGNYNFNYTWTDAEGRIIRTATQSAVVPLSADWTDYDMLAFFITSLDDYTSRVKRTASPIIVYTKDGSDRFAGAHGSDFDFYRQDTGQSGNSEFFGRLENGRDPIRFQGGIIQRIPDSQRADRSNPRRIRVSYSGSGREYLHKIVGINDRSV